MMMIEKITMNGITVQYPTPLVIEFGYPLITSHIPSVAKSKLVQGGWVFPKFEPLKDPRKFALLVFWTTCLSS